MKHLLLFIAVILVSCTTTKQNIDLNQYMIKESVPTSLLEDKTVDDAFKIVELVINRHYPNNKIKIVLNFHIEPCPDTNNHNQIEDEQVDFDEIDESSEIDGTEVEASSGVIGGMNLRNMPLSDVISYICEVAGLDYSVNENIITISKAVPPVDLSKYIIKRPSEILDLSLTFNEVLLRLEKAMDADYPGHNIEFIFDSELHNKRMKFTVKPNFTEEESSSFTYEGSEDFEDHFDGDFEDDEFEAEFEDDFGDDFEDDEFEDDFDEDFETDELEDVAPVEVTSGTLGSFGNMPLDDTIAYICQTVGCRYKVKGNKVIIY